MLSICITMISCEKDNDGVNNSISLIGDWKLKSSCGGFTGACNFPKEDYNKILLIRDSTIAEYINGTNSFTFDYEIKSHSIHDDYIYYELQFNNTTQRIKVDKSELHFEKGDFVETYSRR